MGGEKQSSRLLEYDFIRVVAMVFVIGVHTMARMTFSGGAALYQNVAQSLLFTCNGLFFAISGRFALVPVDSYRRYYVKKAITLGIPVLFCFFLRTVFLMVWGQGYWAGAEEIFTQFLINIMGGLKDTEYWFLFFLMGNLAAAPLIARAFCESGGKTCRVFLLVGMVYHGFLLTAQMLGLPFGYGYLFSGWSFYFYIGVCAERCIPEKKLPWLWAVAAGCLVLNTLLKSAGYTNGAHDLSPVFTGIVLGMYFLLRRVGQQIKSPWMTGIVRFLAKHSLSVYLVHSMVQELMTQKWNLTGLLTGSSQPVRHVVYLMLVLSVSVVVAAVLDALLHPMIKGLTALSARAERRNSTV